jgi:hypothetical protein
MRALTLTLAVFGLATMAQAQLVEKPVCVAGVLTLEVFPGPPNYASIEHGDRREEAWILTTETRERFHLVSGGLVLPSQSIFRPLRGKKVVVGGVALESRSGYQRAPWVVTVAAIQRQPEEEKDAVKARVPAP